MSEYIPAEGVKCEVSYNGHGRIWFETTVLFVGDQIVVFTVDDIGTERAASIRVLEFREIKSERQKFIDAHRDEIEKLVLATMVKDTAGNLFDAGYRKP